MEQRVCCDALPTVELMRSDNGRNHEYIENDDDVDVGTKDIVFPKLSPRIPHGRDNQAEAYASDEHEDDEYRLDVSRIIGGYAYVLRGESSRRNSSQTMTDAVEESHGANPKQHD